MFEVIPGVDNNREVFRWKDLSESMGKLRATDAAG
jgi:hypothetical protein